MFWQHNIFIKKCGRCLMDRVERAVEVGGGGAAVDQEVGTGDECALGGHQEFGDVGVLMAVPGL